MWDHASRFKIILAQANGLRLSGQGKAIPLTILYQQFIVVHLEGASHDIRRTRFEGYMLDLKDFLRDICQS